MNFPNINITFFLVLSFFMFPVAYGANSCKSLFFKSGSKVFSKGGSRGGPNEGHYRLLKNPTTYSVQDRMLNGVMSLLLKGTKGSQGLKIEIIDYDPEMFLYTNGIQVQHRDILESTKMSSSGSHVKTTLIPYRNHYTNEPFFMNYATGVAYQLPNMVKQALLLQLMDYRQASNGLKPLLMDIEKSLPVNRQQFMWVSTHDGKLVGMLRVFDATPTRWLFNAMVSEKLIDDTEYPFSYSDPGNSSSSRAPLEYFLNSMGKSSSIMAAYNESAFENLEMRIFELGKYWKNPDADPSNWLRANTLIKLWILRRLVLRFPESVFIAQVSEKQNIRRNHRDWALGSLDVETHNMKSNKYNFNGDVTAISAQALQMQEVLSTKIFDVLMSLKLIN